jgi:hypothetical protein
MIDGYAELLELRRSGQIPDTAILLTDSEVIEWSWAEILRDHPAVDREVPPCAVLRIRKEEPHDLLALRGLHVICLLARKSSETWLARARSARPADIVPVVGPEAYRVSARLADAFFDQWMAG